MDPDDLISLERIPRSRTVRCEAPLKFLPFQTNLFDYVSAASGSDSELSGPFSDVVYSKEFEGKNRARRLCGKDLYEGFSFSAKFKSAMEGVKRERRNETPPTATDDEIGEKFKLGLDNAADVEFNFPDFPDVDRAEDSEVEEKKKEKNGGIDKKKWAKFCPDEDEIFDTMSGYWRLLSDFDEFRISPPWYDAYAEGKEHWLQTKPVANEVFENSRTKCLNWLQNNFGK